MAATAPATLPHCASIQPPLGLGRFGAARLQLDAGSLGQHPQRLAKADVFPHGQVVAHEVLQDDGKALSQLVHFEVADVDAVEHAGGEGLGVRALGAEDRQCPLLEMSSPVLDHDILRGVGADAFAREGANPVRRVLG